MRPEWLAKLGSRRSLASSSGVGTHVSELICLKALPLGGRHVSGRRRVGAERRGEAAKAASMVGGTFG